MLFHSLETKICIIWKNVEKLWLQSPLASYARKIYINVIFYVSILHAKFCRIPSNIIRDRTITKTLLERHLLRNFHQKLVYINLCLNNTKYKVSLNFVDCFSSTCTEVLSQWHRLIDISQKIVKSCSGHPKTCKSIKNRNPKNSTKPIFLSLYIRKHWFRKIF